MKNESQKANSNPDEKVTAIVVNIPNAVQAILTKQDWNIDVKDEMGQKWLYFKHKKEDRTLIIPATGVVFQKDTTRAEIKRMVVAQRTKQMAEEAEVVTSLEPLADLILGAKSVMRESYEQYEKDKAAGMSEEEAMEKAHKFVDAKIKEKAEEMNKGTQQTADTAETKN